MEGYKPKNNDESKRDRTDDIKLAAAAALGMASGIVATETFHQYDKTPETEIQQGGAAYAEAMQRGSLSPENQRAIDDFLKNPEGGLTLHFSSKEVRDLEDQLVSVGGEVTRVDLEGSEKVVINPENPDSDPVTVTIEGSRQTTVNLDPTEKVRIDPVNPDSDPVTVILKGTEKVRIDPVNPDSDPTVINL